MTTVVDRPTPSPEEVNRSYLEYRRACYRILYRHAAERGLLDALEQPRTPAELIEAMGFLPQREDTLGLLLDALVRFGCCRQVDAGAYEAVQGFEDPEQSYDRALIAAAIGSEKVEALLHGNSYAGIVDVLYREDNPVAAAFDEDNADLWDEFLQTPYYTYSRRWAVGRIARPGAAVLDLACGPGFGLRELSEAVGASGSVTGVEVSPTFVETARERTSDLPTVGVTHANLDEGLEFLGDDQFDGAMIVGAYHFLTRRERLMAEVARVLRPGGTFAVAYVHSRIDAYDRELMELRFSLRQPPAYAPTREEVVDLAARHGLHLEPGDFAIGSWPSYAFRNDG